MQIDWITVGAQIVNFLVLVWLLQHFLYGPITRAMQRREQRINDRLRDAECAKEEAEEEAENYRAKQKELETQREGILADARDEAEDERRSLVEEARTEVEHQKRLWLGQLREQRETFLRELRQRAAEQFCVVARKALLDIADAELEEQTARVFIKKLETLDQDTKERLMRQIDRHKDGITIRSCFDLSPNIKRQITKAVHDQLGEDASVDYRADTGVPCGIELKAGSQTVSWSLDSYLDGLERSIGKQFFGFKVPMEIGIEE